ncbi:uncharacterized protein LOC142573732 [Dermacentor variabilis]|uniref:uncharacterized protein LOC142573732 n=1 Tax=Dermacentor variabilis TaxID=34621 RepID=UPI003F5BD281
MQPPIRKPFSPEQRTRPGPRRQSAAGIWSRPFDAAGHAGARQERAAGGRLLASARGRAGPSPFLLAAASVSRSSRSGTGADVEEANGSLPAPGSSPKAFKDMAADSSLLQHVCLHRMTSS